MWMCFNGPLPAVLFQQLKPQTKDLSCRQTDEEINIQLLRGWKWIRSHRLALKAGTNRQTCPDAWPSSRLLQLSTNVSTPLTMATTAIDCDVDNIKDKENGKYSFLKRMILCFTAHTMRYIAMILCVCVRACMCVCMHVCCYSCRTMYPCTK